MTAVTYKKYRNSLNQICWMSENLSGMFIVRAFETLGTIYRVNAWTMNGVREIASFDTLKKARAFVAKGGNR